MARASLCKCYTSLSFSDKWMSAVEIALTTALSRRTTEVCARELAEDGLAEVKIIDRRKYYRLLPGHADSSLAADIFESMEITQ